MQFTYIQDQQELLRYCQQVSHAEVLAVDTEFVRTRTLYPNLGLIQAYDGNELALIDPVAIDDLEPFWQLLRDESLLKVIHSCSEDLEVFLQSGNCKPANMIDSQVIMSFLGHGLSMGYAAMIKHYLTLELDKSESRTDWMKRPLSESQLHYAAADVLHLHQICERLFSDINQVGFYQAAKLETQQQIEKKFTAIDADLLYLENKQAWKLQPQQLLFLQHLLAWRYEQAVARNLPLSFVAKEHTLMILAQRNPQSVGAMANYDGVDILDVRHKGKAMLNVLKTANKEPVEVYPARLTRLDSYPNYKQVFKAVKQKIAELAKQQDLDPQIVAGKKQIHQFLSWFWQLNQQKIEKVDLLTGWRGQLFAKALAEFADNGF
ncbi:ribonuclease D [Thalassotalea sp. ND16A]|uniref:ribonuclease D n=1 Tax=Thalassotalea sp. ND16A TaxID=1535422 RepID=UPI00051D5F50|nr:ribonuclease D [Thalassotalea sp. ND16A]KGJ87477.1 Ribonuclease D [Thalassotalea sp. ND16A]